MKTLKQVVILISILFTSTVIGQIKLPKLISDGMILQRDTTIKIWGWAAPNEAITVNFLNQDYNITASSTGNWELPLTNLAAGGPHKMILKATNTITINDILIGDVWLCSGQSNMAMTVGGTGSTYQTDINNSTNDRIRNFNVPREYEFTTPRTDLSSGLWMKANPTDVRQFSAVAYFFAKELYARNPSVPIGLINASHGGTPIHAWMSEKSLKNFPENVAEIQLLKNPAYVNNLVQNDIDIEKNWDTTLKNNDLGVINNWKSNTTNTATWGNVTVPFTKKDIGSVWYKKDITVTADMAANPSSLQLGTLIDVDSTYVNGKLVGFNKGEWTARRYEIPANTFVLGTNTVTVRLVSNSLTGGFTGNTYQLVGGSNNTEIVDLKGTWKSKVGFAMATKPAPVNWLWKPTALYNAMLGPVKNYALKGAIWYQGEGNSGRPSQYSILLRSLIEDWRSFFNNPTMPFLYVQLPNYQAAVANPAESSWALLRESQLKTMAVPFTGMVTTIDVGDPNDIHPVAKRPVGVRLALAAQRVVYGNEQIVSSGPLYKSMKVVGNTVELTFDTLGSSSMQLIVRGSGTAIGTHSNFAIAGSNKVFSWAQARIEGNKVIVWNDAIPNPVAVRYAWGQNPAGVKLFNIENLPASPFRTDSWITGKQYILINYN